MKWFERGQLFDSRDAAKDAGFGRGERRWEGPRPERERDDARSTREPGERGARSRDERPRDKNWRPGGEHRDPRQKYRDAKKAKWNRFKQGIRDRHARRQGESDEFPPQTFTPPHGDPFRDRRTPSRPRAGAHTGKSFGSTPGARKPWGAKPGAGSPRKPWSDEPGGGRKPWSGKPASTGRKPWSGKPTSTERKPWSGKPASTDTRKAWGGPQKSWGAKPKSTGPRKPWSKGPTSGRKPFSPKPKRRRDDEE